LRMPVGNSTGLADFLTNPDTNGCGSGERLITQSPETEPQPSDTSLTVYRLEPRIE